MKKSVATAEIAELLAEAGIITRLEKKGFVSHFNLESIAADGSLRSFFRIMKKDHSLGLAVFPDNTGEKGRDEARSAALIGRHLHGKGIPVAEILASDDKTGLLIFEDCGDTRLHDVIMGMKHDPASLFDEHCAALYHDIVGVLARMQVLGMEGFDPRWCYDTVYYDREVMLEREAVYFLNAFWYGLLGEKAVDGLYEEFEDIATHAADGPCKCFLHRDFQSRNIMIVNQGVRIIDFQAGRIGPPGYDLASLLIDPYSNIAPWMSHNLLEKYFNELRNYLEFDEVALRRQYVYLALQRNLQILGAFSFLYRKRSKVFFKDYIRPALLLLGKRLEDSDLLPYSILRKVAAKALQKIDTVL